MEQLHDDCPDNVTEVSSNIRITGHALQGLPALYASPVFGMFEARLKGPEPPSAAACEALMRLVTVMRRSYINTDVDKSRGGETQYMEDVWGELRHFLQSNVQNRDLVRTFKPSSLPEVSQGDVLTPNLIWICFWLTGLSARSLIWICFWLSGLSAPGLVCICFWLSGFSSPSLTWICFWLSGLSAPSLLWICFWLSGFSAPSLIWTCFWLSGFSAASLIWICFWLSGLTKCLHSTQLGTCGRYSVVQCTYLSIMW